MITVKFQFLFLGILIFYGFYKGFKEKISDDWIKYKWVANFYMNVFLILYLGIMDSYFWLENSLLSFFFGIGTFIFLIIILVFFYYEIRFEITKESYVRRNLKEEIKEEYKKIQERFDEKKIDISTEKSNILGMKNIIIEIPLKNVSLVIKERLISKDNSVIIIAKKKIEAKKMINFIENKE
ncbi:MAG: hypothetical protein ACOCRX_12215 [Candidatus Woesearchaeota archaeon]